MYYYLAGAILVLLAVWAVGSYVVIRNIEEPTFTVVENRDAMKYVSMHRTLWLKQR